MGIRKFYNSLGNWIEAVNQASQTMEQDDYWDYVMKSAGVLSEQYGEHQLIKDVINVHIDYLEAIWKEANKKQEE